MGLKNVENILGKMHQININKIKFQEGKPTITIFVI